MVKILKNKFLHAPSNLITIKNLFCTLDYYVIIQNIENERCNCIINIMYLYICI